MPMMVPLQGAEIPPLPAWAGKICEQLSKTIFKRLLELRPQGDQVNWRNVGKMLGVWQRIVTVLAERWKDSECVLPEEAIAPPKEAPDSCVMIPQTDLLAAMQESLTASIVDNLAKNPVEQSEFFAGLGEGYELFLDTNGQFTGDRGRTKVYLELLGHWTEIEAMRKTNPPSTALDVYKLIAVSLGDPDHQRFDWFCDVCDGIGLFVKKRGRPAKPPRK